MSVHACLSCSVGPAMSSSRVDPASRPNAAGLGYTPPHDPGNSSEKMEDHLMDAKGGGQNCGACPVQCSSVIFAIRTKSFTSACVRDIFVCMWRASVHVCVSVSVCLLDN